MVQKIFVKDQNKDVVYYKVSKNTDLRTLIIGSDFLGK